MVIQLDRRVDKIYTWAASTTPVFLCPEWGFFLFRNTHMRLRDLIDAIPDTAAISVASKTTLGASGTGLLASMVQWNWTAIIASVVAIVGLVANLYFQRRRDKREREFHEAQLEILRKGGGQCN